MNKHTDRYILETYENDWNDYATVYWVKGDTREEIGMIGGEPEDNTYYRDYAWIVPALNEAYQRGRDDEYDRLQDKV